MMKIVSNGKKDNDNKTTCCAASVIIPVYNTEKYLYQCLDSVLSQTLKEIEVICVDDGSTDGSLDLLKEYAEKDSRVIVLSQPNTNAGAARNNGMRIARGNYLVFLDSDDWFESNMLELAYNRIIQYDSDICIWAGDEFLEDGSKFDNGGFLVEKLISKEPFNYLDANEFFFSISNPAPWTKMYKMQFIKQYSLQFQEIKFSNDVYFTSAAFALAGSIVSVRKKLIHYRKDSINNLSSKRSTAPLLFTEALLALKEKLIIEQRYNILRCAFANFALSVSEFNLKKLDKSSSSFKGVADEFVGHYLDELDLLSGNSLRCTSLLKMLFGEMSNVPPKKVIGGIQFTPAVSIVIPVYNTENYLRQCLDSVVNQTYRNTEIICIDDGSTDNSLSILEEYAEKDNRVCIISEINGGLSCARNRGIANASGEYIYFMDSDDCLVNDAIEKLYQIAKTEDYDLVCFEKEVFFESSELERQFASFKRVPSYTKEIADKVFENGIAMFNTLLDSNCFHSNVPFLFINRNFLLKSNVMFFEGIIHEDELFSPLLLTKAVRAKCINDKLYLRRVRSSSTMTSPNNAELSIIGLFTVAVELFSRGVVNSKTVTIDGSNILIRYAENVLESAKQKYMLLSHSQRADIKNKIPIAYYHLFEICIENSALTQTNSFKIGRAITWFPRKFRAGLKCIKENGFLFTLVLFARKLKNKFHYLKHKVN